MALAVLDFKPFRPGFPVSDIPRHGSFVLRNLGRRCVSGERFPSWFIGIGMNSTKIEHHVVDTESNAADWTGWYEMLLTAALSA
jgi:hypothetical protein